MLSLHSGNNRKRAVEATSGTKNRTRDVHGSVSTRIRLGNSEKALTAVLLGDKVGITQYLEKHLLMRLRKVDNTGALLLAPQSSVSEHLLTSQYGLREHQPKAVSIVGYQITFDRRRLEGKLNGTVGVYTNRL